MSDDTIQPKPTSFSSSRFAMRSHWSPADVVISASVIVLDDQDENAKVLVVQNRETGLYQFPWCINDKGDIGEFAESPFETDHERGYVLEKRALPRLWREYKNPQATDWRELEVETTMLDYNTYDPFFMTVDIMYFKPYQTSKDISLETMQRISLWFACRAPANDSEHVMWMTFDEASGRKKLMDQQCPDTAGRSALEQLVAVWMNPATHQFADTLGP